VLRKQRRADLALTAVEPLPEALQGAVAQVTAEGTDGLADAVAGGAPEKAAQRSGAEAEAADLVGAPDADGPAAAAPGIAVAAKQPPRPHNFAPGTGFVIAAQTAVANQRADHLAVRAGRQLEPFGQRVPFVIVAAKPLPLAHAVSERPNAARDGRLKCRHFGRH